MVCLFMVDIVVALVGSRRRSMLGKGNLSFGRALFNLKESTPINLHIFLIAPPVAFFFNTDNWLLTRIGPRFLGSAPKFTSSNSSFGGTYAFLSISISFSGIFISSILALFRVPEQLHILRILMNLFPSSIFFCPKDPLNHKYCFLLLLLPRQEPLGFLM